MLLILLAIILFALETQIASQGVLTIGGIVAMVLGSLMLFEPGGELYRVSISLVITSTAVTTLFFAVVVRLVVNAHRRVPATGSEGLVGVEGVAQTDIGPRGGQAHLHGEFWTAHSDEEIEAGAQVKVESSSGLKVKVRKI